MGTHDRMVEFVSEPSTVEITGGVARIRDCSGGVRSERAMAVKTLAITAGRYQRALDAYAKGQERIVIDD